MGGERISEAIREVYERVGREGSRPPGGLSLSTGRDLAEDLGYPPTLLDALPPRTLDAFVGAAPLFQEVHGRPGEWVLDLGCGSGLDSLILAEAGYRVVAVDASAAMLRRLGASAEELPERRVHPVRAALPRIPVAARAASWVLLNGVANLVVERDALLAEIRRVLRPDGSLLLADLVELGEIPPEVRDLPEAWAWCLGGAATPERWRECLGAAGFRGVEVTVLEEFLPLGRGMIRATAP